MKRIIPLIILLLLGRIAFAQNSNIWTKCLGGSSDDEGYSIALTHDKGYIVTGMSFSPVGGDITFTHGFGEVWVVKLDSLGAIQWQKCYGGSGADWGKSIKETPDHGFIVAGTTFDSYGGDITQLYGGIDYWTIKIDSVGNLIWAKTFGGYSDDELYSVAIANDGGYVFAGSTYSNDGNVTGNHGHSDFWAVKTDVNGNIVWKKCYGGPMWDHCFAISATADHGFVLCGDAGGNGGDVTGVHTNAVNYWIVKIDSVGNLEWQKVYGGYSYDVAYSIKQTADKGYIVGGTAQSNNGDVIGNHGYYDYWALRLDSSGNLLWQKALGGSNDDECYGADISADGGYFFGGWSFSHNGDVTDQIGNGDYWIVKLDSAGAIQSKRSYGGSGSEWCYAIQITPDGGMIATGYTQSNNIDVSGNHGGNDYWVVKQRDDNLITGNCFLDANMNGIQDSTENGFNHFLVHASGGSYTYAAQPDLNGVFRCYSDTGTILTHVLNSTYYSVVPAEDSSRFRSYFNTDTVNFAIQPHPGIQNLQIEIIPTDIATPGAQTDYRLIYTSIGTDTVSGTVVMIPDSDLFYVSADPAVDSLAGDSLIWNFESLLPYETRVINLKLQADIPPDVVAGDYLRSAGIIEPLASDSDKNDNTFALSQEVLASLDPNDKSMLGGNSITPEQVMNGEDLTYLIRFQNTGNAPAINITITDTLSDLLVGNTFYPVDISHPYSVSIKDDRFVTWQFDNILLPDSNVNEPESHGYIVYRIKPKGNLTYGDTIHNTASIYFDYNDGVETNDALVTVCSNIFSEATKTICEGDSLFAGGAWQHDPGAYYDYFSTIHGCDSIIKTIIALNSIDTSIEVIANMVVAAFAGAEYQWIDCDNNLPVAGATNQSFIPAYSGHFYVAITSGNCHASSSCVAFICEDSVAASATICEGDSIFMGGAWQHQAGIYLDHFQNVNGCDSLVVTDLTIKQVEDSLSADGNILTALQDSATYQWINCDDNQPIPGATDQTFEAMSAGNYKVQITANGCTITSACVSIIGTGTDQTPTEKRFSLFPNPSDNEVTIISSECCLSEIKFCNNLGVVVKSIGPVNAKSVTVSINDLPAGIYIVQFWDDKLERAYQTMIKK